MNMVSEGNDQLDMGTEKLFIQMKVQVHVSMQIYVLSTFHPPNYITSAFFCSHSRMVQGDDHFHT